MKKIFLFISTLFFFISYTSCYAYIDMNQNLYANNFYSSGSSTFQVGYVKIVNNVLQVNFNVSWTTPQYLTPPSIPLQQPVPDMAPVFFTFSSSGATIGYYYRVYNNSLVFGYAGGQPTQITSCSTNTSQPIPCLPLTWYQDSDGDGYGNASITTLACSIPAGYVANNTDCNDTDAAIKPTTVWYTDADADGYGSTIIKATQCLKPALSSLNNLDCNDTTNTITIAPTWYADTDADGFGDPTVTLVSCLQPIGYVNNNGDKCPLIKGTIQGCIVPVVSSTNNSSNFGNDMNYIISSTPKIPTTNLQTISNSKDVNTTITYFDGLGRPIETIASKQSNSGKDIVTPIVYDAFGRQEKEYLPYAATQSSLAFMDANTVIANATAQYQTNYGDSNIFSQKQFESSPLNRVLQQAAPGNDWSLANNHTIKLDYQTNVLNEVKLFTATASGISYSTNGYYAPTLAQTTSYPASQLYKTVTKDENWVSGNGDTTEEFKDKEGRVVLKRTYSTVGTGTVLVAHDTYYVYDQFGNLTFVLPPKVDVSSLPTTAILEDLCYQYRYDNRNRLVEKKLPGKQWEFIVYDKLDRVIATGPALAPFSNLQTVPPAAPNVGWLITKYDVFNRPVLTGWMPSTTVTSAGRKTLQDSRNADTLLNETKPTTATNSTVNGVAFRYSNVAFPASTTSYHVLTVNYYDTYDTNIVFAPAISYTATAALPVYYTNTAGTLPKGLATISWVRVLETSTLYKAETSYTLYDNKARTIRVFSNNFLGGYTQVDSQMEAITGRINYTTTTHNRSATTAPVITVTDTYTYDSQDRQIKHMQTVNTNPAELIAENTYDELGQLTSKKVGNTSTAPLQKIDYNYNIRGWLTGINNDATNNLILNTTEKDLFGFKINYNSIQNETGYTGKELYNGNIAETYWRTSNDNVLRKYGYKYDAINRLQSAVYQKPSTTVPVTNMYNESMSYDKNGNIMALQRNGDFDAQSLPLPIDDLTYSYDAGNRLQWVQELSTNNGTLGFKDGVYTNANTATLPDFVYDANGNMIVDRNKAITNIKYNHLNLPTEIFYTTTKKINYIYTATGTKVQKIITQGTTISTTDYLGGYQYFKQGTAAVALQFFPHAEGYVNFDSGVYKHVFNYTDHLGNVRLSYTKDVVTGLPTIMEENHYYPFGLKHTNYNVAVMKLRGANVLPDASLIPKNKYKYQGQELQDELGLNMYAMDMRLYDPAIARWTVIDPITHLDESSYTAFSNNPVFFADPSGASPIYNSTTGQYVIDGNVVSFEEALSYANSGGNSNGNNNNKPSQGGKETLVQEAFRKTTTSFITNLDKQTHGDYSEKQSDQNVDAYELFYQWIMGTGSSTRNFDQNSTMGQQMLQAPEILEAINNVATNGGGVSFRRKLSEESALSYVKSFFEDSNGKNPARAFHGSFAGKVTVDSVTRSGNIVTTNMTIIMTDRMSATSGTRAPPSSGGYGKNPTAIYTKENPYGSNGQFRTITVNYNMNVSITKRIR
jgi:RHS repeat-associated protein